MDKNAKRTIATTAIAALVMLSLFGTVGLTTKAATPPISCGYSQAPTAGTLGDKSPLIFTISYYGVDMPGAAMMEIYRPDGYNDHAYVDWVRQTQYEGPDKPMQWVGTFGLYPADGDLPVAGDYTVQPPSWFVCPSLETKVVHISPRDGNQPSGGESSDGQGGSPIHEPPTTLSPTAPSASATSNSGSILPNVQLPDIPFLSNLPDIPFLSSNRNEANASVDSAAGESAGGSSASGGSSSGGWMWLFVIMAIVLIAAILGFVWWSRRGRYEEEDEGYVDDGYQRLEERRR